MKAENSVRERQAKTVIARTTARRAVRSGALWGALFGLLVWNEALSYGMNFPTPASRESFAESFGDNSGMAAIIGPGRDLATIEGFVAWRMFGLMMILGAIWGFLTATRLLRGEEDAGRWELLLSGRTSRRHAAVQGIVGLTAGLVALWVMTAAFTVAAGLSLEASTSRCRPRCSMQRRERQVRRCSWRSVH